MVVIVGINDYRWLPRLRGCLADVAAWQMLFERNGFAEDDVVVLTEREATAAAIKDALSSAPRDEVLFFVYAGHGTQVPDQSGDESDDRDEALCPYDFNWHDDSTWIVDDTLAEIGAKRKAPLILIVDACHSGTVSRSDTRPVPPEPGTSFRFVYPPAWLFSKQQREPGTTVRSLSMAPKRTLLVAACRDDQVARETHATGVTRGLASYCLQRTWTPSVTYEEWVAAAREAMAKIVDPALQQIQLLGDEKLMKEPALVPPAMPPSTADEVAEAEAAE